MTHVPVRSRATITARNLHISPADRRTLATVFNANHRATGRVGQAIRGSVFYGEADGHRYALASFDTPRLGAQDQPELFVHTTRGWRDLGDTGGDPWGRVELPVALLRRWGIPPRTREDHQRE
jgi:hypothetical protein